MTLGLSNSEKVALRYWSVGFAPNNQSRRVSRNRLTWMASVHEHVGGLVHESLIVHVNGYVDVHLHVHDPEFPSVTPRRAP